MKFSTGRPPGITWTITGTWAVAFAVDAAGDSTGPSLSDGDVQLPARFQWRVAAPSNTDYVDVKAAFAPSISVGLVGLTGVTLPVGTLIEIHNGAAAVLTEVEVIELAEGGRCAWALLPVPTISGDIRFRIKNSDGAGATVLASGEYVDLGEGWIGQVRDAPIQEVWAPKHVDPTTYERGAVSSLNADPQLTYRRFVFRADVLALLELIDGATDWEHFVASINRGQRCVVIPRTSCEGLDDAYVVARTAVFGMVSTVPDVGHVGGDYFQGQADGVLNEDPSPPVN